MNNDRYIPLLMSNRTFESKPSTLDKNDSKQVVFSVDELRQCLAEGHWVCPTASKKEDVEQSNAAFVIIDIDGVQQDFVDFVERMTIKPTFAYTSYSHLVQDEVHQGRSRFRLVYVFEQPFSGKYYYGLYRHIGDKNKLPELGFYTFVNEKGEEKKKYIYDNLSPNQAYFGNPHAQWWTSGKTYNVPPVEKLEEFAEKYADGWRTGSAVRVDFGLSDEIKKDFNECITVSHFAKNHKAPILTIYHHIEGTNFMQIEQGRRRVRSPRKLVNQQWGKWQHGDGRHSILYVACLSVAEQLDFQGDLTPDNYLAMMARIFARDFIEDKKWDKRRFFSAVLSGWNAYHNGKRAEENEQMRDVIVAYNAPKRTGKSKKQLAPTIRTYKRLRAFDPGAYYDIKKSQQENYKICRTIYEQATGGFMEYVSYQTFVSDIAKSGIEAFSETESKKEINDIMERYLIGVMARGEAVQRIRHGKGLHQALADSGISRDPRTTRKDAEKMEWLNREAEMKAKMATLRKSYISRYGDEDTTFDEAMMMLYDAPSDFWSVCAEIEHLQQDTEKNDKKK